MSVLRCVIVSAVKLSRTHSHTACCFILRTRPYRSLSTSSRRDPPSPTSLTRSPQTLVPRALAGLTAPRPNAFLMQVQIEQQKARSRPQNLSTRWQRLERSLRGKEAYSAHIDELVAEADPDSEAASDDRDRETVAGKVRGAKPMVFHGLVIPEEPREPRSDECCMSGCAICVYDLYAAAREDYTHAVEAVRTALDARGIPDNEWPVEIRRLGKADIKKGKKESTRDVTWNAFEALERLLQEKREKEREDVEPG